MRRHPKASLATIEATLPENFRKTFCAVMKEVRAQYYKNVLALLDSDGQRNFLVHSYGDSPHQSKPQSTKQGRFPAVLGSISHEGTLSTKSEDQNMDTLVVETILTSKTGLKTDSTPNEVLPNASGAIESQSAASQHHSRPPRPTHVVAVPCKC
jgi:hypothetical protein